jgi:anti-sigma regulatory factor (Ser/Thr protein kinase)
MSEERPLSVVRQFPADDDAPGNARDAAAELLSRLRVGKAGQARAGDLALVVSELVSNAVVHGPGEELELRLTWRPSTIRVEVTDAGRTDFDWPELHGGSGHWGLGLVKTFSERVGITRQPSTCVWCELDLDRPPAQ